MLQIREPASHSKAVAATPQVLVVDSDAQMRHYLTRLLSAHYGIDSVTDAWAAFTLARELAPDLVLANAMTQVADGADLVREFRRDARLGEVPIILYSRRAGEGLCLEGMEAGANDYLITPFSERALLARIGAHLRVAEIFHEGIRALGDSEERYRTLANATSTAVWSAAPNGDIVGEVHGWEKMTGQNPEEYRGFTWMDVVHPAANHALLEISQH